MNSQQKSYFLYSKNDKFVVYNFKGSHLQRLVRFLVSELIGSSYMIPALFAKRCSDHLMMSYNVQIVKQLLSISILGYPLNKYRVELIVMYVLLYVIKI